MTTLTIIDPWASDRSEGVYDQLTAAYAAPAAAKLPSELATNPWSDVTAPAVTVAQAALQPAEVLAPARVYDWTMIDESIILSSAAWGGAIPASRPAATIQVEESVSMNLLAAQAPTSTEIEELSEEEITFGPAPKASIIQPLSKAVIEQDYAVEGLEIPSVVVPASLSLFQKAIAKIKALISKLLAFVFLSEKDKKSVLEVESLDGRTIQLPYEIQG